MKILLFLLCIGGAFVWAMDVDPDRDQHGYDQRNPLCWKMCREVTEPDGTIIEFYEQGRKKTCEIGANDSCTLQVCDADCRGY